MHRPTHLAGNCNCGTCSTKTYFHPGGMPLDTVSRMALLHHNAEFGTNTCVNCEGLSSSTTYYWVVFLIDEAGNRSPFSNVFQRATLGCESILEVQC